VKTQTTDMRAILPIYLSSLATGTAILPRKESLQAISKDGFVHVDGLRLYDSKGSLHYLTGTADSLTGRTEKLTEL
jgi:hypothetical protein